MRVLGVLLSLVCGIYATTAATYNESLAYRYVEFAGAAYCCGMALGDCAAWDCYACKGDLSVTEIYNKSTQARGFAGYDRDTNTIVVAFSGTDPLSMKDWIDDIDTVKVDYPNCDGCEVHKGFYQTYLSVRAQVHAAVESYLSQSPTAKYLEITGHSLGAALAQHCTLDLALSGYTIAPMYNFGQPRTGNDAFTNYYDETMAATWRITHHKDPVPHLPWESWGFHHEPTEVFYNEKNTAYTVCDGSGEDSACSDQYLADLNVWDHLTYMNFDFVKNYMTCKL